MVTLQTERMGVTGLIDDVQPFAELFVGATTLVYKAYQRSQDRFVLLKTLRPEFRFDSELCDRFQEEARLAARIQHPNVVAMYGYGQTEQGAYLIAEFVDGLNLADIVSIGKMPFELAVYVLYETTKGLQAAHHEGILHRDIKPSNVLISFEGEVKLTDFGMASFLASEESADQVRGTLAYLAPEHARGQILTEASDLFSLGATFFELLTGRRAFGGSKLGDYFDAILHHDPMPFLEVEHEIPPQLKQICRRLLTKDPSQRYSSTAALLADLHGFWARYESFSGQAAMKYYLQDPAAYLESIRPQCLQPDVVVTNHRPVDAGSFFTVDRRRRDRPVRPRTTGVQFRIFLLFAGLIFSAGLLGSLRIDHLLGLARVDGLEPRSLFEDAESFYQTDSFSEGFSNPMALSEALLEAETRAILKRAPVKKEITQEKLEPVQEEPPEPFPSSVERSVAASGGKGSLRFEVHPFATVYVDGDSVGVTPLGTAYPLLPGEHEIVFRNGDFPETRRKVFIEAGVEDTLIVSLLKEIGQVFLDVSPWAHVEINGLRRDTTPLDKPIFLAPGYYSMRLVHDSLGTYETKLNIRADSIYNLKYNLQKLSEENKLTPQE